jgi:hypothetical protein
MVESRSRGGKGQTIQLGKKIESTLNNRIVE